MFQVRKRRRHEFLRKENVPVMTIDTISENRAFGGVQGIYGHRSRTLDCDMRVSVFVPPQAKNGPVRSSFGFRV